jgi:hypothetical protein
MSFGSNWRQFPPIDNQWLRLQDPYVHALTTISEPHRLIHDGMMYDVSGIVASTANGANIDIAMRLPAGFFGHLIQMEWAVEDAPCDVFFYENTIFSGGTDVKMKNHSRPAGAGTATDNPGLTMVEGPTVTDVGDLIHDRFIPAAGVPGGQSGGLLVPGEDHEWILGSAFIETTYLWRLTNNSGGAIRAGYHFNGYAVRYEDK